MLTDDSTLGIRMDGVAANRVADSVSTEQPAITSDGRYVRLHSHASNLVLGDTNDSWDAFVHDRRTEITARVSVDSAGGQGNDSSGNPDISASACLQMPR